MLKIRVITALLLLAVLLPVLYFASFPAFAIVATLFFGAAMWESQRLFQKPMSSLIAVVWTILFGGLIVSGAVISEAALFALCSAFWIVKFIPSLSKGLPKNNQRIVNSLFSGMYSACIFACFVAITSLFNHSPVFLLSVMAIVWVADIGAYFSGKAFGRRKLAPSISPGKSWEGAIGGWVAVLLIGFSVSKTDLLLNTFPSKVLSTFGLFGFVLIMSLLVVFSVVGDLFESSLKRRAGVKDSSALLPGHGGVLDRIDALIPVMPIAALVVLWLK